MTSEQPRKTMWWLLVVALSAAIVAAASLGTWQFVTKNAKPVDSAVNNAAARQVVLDAAKANVVKVLSYKADTFDQDVATARTVLTGDGLDEYNKQIDTVRATGLLDKAVVYSSNAIGAAVESMDSEKASIIVFVDATQTSSDQPTPKNIVAAVRLGMVKSANSWLIAKLGVL